MSKLKINPCWHCKEQPSSGYYPGDFSIECESCLTTVSRHMVDFPHLSFEVSSQLTKDAATRVWNRLNPLHYGMKGQASGTQFEAK